jgi:uncharacterized protein DUF4397
MMRSWLAYPCVLCLALVACGRDATFTEPMQPLASVTFVNAVPDTNKLAFRVVDIASNAGLYAAPFRGVSTFPVGIEAGARRIKVFFDTTDVVLAKTVMLDTTFSFAQGEHYSFLLAGFARTGQTPALRAMITADGVLPTPPPGKFAIRVVNLAPSFAGAVGALADTTVHADALVRRIDALPEGTPEAVDLGYRAASVYAVLDTGGYRIALTATGTSGPAIVQAAVPRGGGTPAVAGSSVSGSILTAVIGPRSVAGSRAPQGGRPAAKAVEAVTRSNDTVTIQSGSIVMRANRPDTTIQTGSPPRDSILRNRPDSVIGGTGTKAVTGVAAGDIVLMSGATEPEYNGWQVVLQVADLLSCNPVAAGDKATKCAATNAIATTQFRYRYRIAGAPTSPATGTAVYRVYPPSLAAADFTTPHVFFVVDKRP